MYCEVSVFANAIINVTRGMTIHNTVVNDVLLEILSRYINKKRVIININIAAGNPIDKEFAFDALLSVVGITTYF